MAVIREALDTHRSESETLPMRGFPCGDCELLPFPGGDQPFGNEQPRALAVLADFDGSLPIGDAELDVVEAFLMPQILALLEDRAPSQEAPPRTRKGPKARRQ